MDNNFDIKKVKVPRTTEGTIMEAIAVLLLIITWVIALARHQFVGATGKDWLIGLAFISIAIIFLFVACYLPRIFNNAHRLRNMRQLLLTIRCSRVIAIEFALMVMSNALLGNVMDIHPEWIWLPLIIILITSLTFTLLIYKAK